MLNSREKCDIDECQGVDANFRWQYKDLVACL